MVEHLLMCISTEDAVQVQGVEHVVESLLVVLNAEVVEGEIGYGSSSERMIQPIEMDID